MKNLLSLLFAIALPITSQASKSLCTGELLRDSGITIQVEGELVNKTTVFQNVTVSVTSDESSMPGESNEQGRAKFILADSNYNPRVYQGYQRFDFEKLVNVADFSVFSPIDSCHIHFLVPQGADRMASFKAVLITNCDQSGGSSTLQCDSAK